MLGRQSRSTSSRRRLLGVGRGEGGREQGGAGRCWGTGGGETSPSANEARALPPRPLPRPNLAALIAQ